MSATLVHSARTRQPRGWDAFDAMVLWDAQRAGLVQTRRVHQGGPAAFGESHTVYDITPAGRSLLGPAGTVPAADIQAA